jgi:uncharacterized protein YjbJ (UPF0337 family)
MGQEEDKERAKGTAEEYKGKGKQAYGSVADDKEAEASGKADEAKGKGRQAASDAKEWLKEKTGQDDESKDKS